MKVILLMAGCMLMCVLAKSQSYEIKQIGKDESDVLFNMKKDTAYVYDKQTYEGDGNYHVTYLGKNGTDICNVFFINHKCSFVVYYYPPSKTPDLISSLNRSYKRTDNDVWIDDTYSYKVQIYIEDNATELCFKKM